jgi:hypothetical protein
MCEVNRLYNEYELQKLPIHNIAKLHQRGEYAILHKLASEGMILTTWADVRGWEYPGKAHTVNSVFFVETINSYVNSLTDDVECSDASSLEDNDDPNDSDYVYESDEDDEDYSDADSDSDSDSDYEDEEASVDSDSDSDYEDESDSKDEAYDPYSIKQKARFLHSIISALKFFVYAA